MKYLLVLLVVLFVVLVLLLVVLFLFRNSSKSKLTSDEEYSYILDNLYNPKWNHYRLGDVFYYSHTPVFKDSTNVVYVYYHLEDFPDSIAAQYLRENKKDGSDLVLLNRIIKERITSDTDDTSTTLFLHIRVGDILCEYKKKRSNNYSKNNNKRWWSKEVISTIKKNNITKVKILAGAHMDKCIQESAKYLLNRKKFLMKKIPGLKVDIIVDKTPDEIILMCYKVKHFITTGGNFGKLINDINNNSSKETFSKNENSITQRLSSFYTKFKNNFEFYNENKKLEVVDQVYSIVMPQRKEYIKNLLDEFNINYTLFNAITVDDLTDKDYSLLTKKAFLRKYKTRLAVQLSFTMCFFHAIENGYKTIIIFEDDIKINVDMDKLVSTIEKFKNSEYIFFYMGYCFLKCNQKFVIDDLIKVNNKQIMCAHSICYKVEYLDKLINFMYPMLDNYDNNITRFIKKYKYDICIPPITFFDQNRTMLGTLNEDNLKELKNCNNYFKLF